jgi:hypothetical protein
VTPGNLELVQIVASWTVTLPAVAAILVCDERRLKADVLERAWPPVSRDAAVFGLWNLGVHPLCVLIHFARTRRTVAGVLWGLGWLLLILLADAGAQAAAAFAVERLGL